MMNTDLTEAIERVKKVCGDTLEVKVINNEKQTDIFFLNPRRNDKLHGHVAVATDATGRKEIPYARPYAKSVRSAWRFG